MKECVVCGSEISEDEGFKCSDCGEACCSEHGDGDQCYYCLGDEIFLVDVLELEKQSKRR